jgi:hypothetical protein
MQNEKQFSKSPGFVTVEMLTNRLNDVTENSINKIHYAHIVQEGDVVNHMPYNSGLYYSDFVKSKMLPHVFNNDVVACKAYK